MGINHTSSHLYSQRCLQNPTSWYVPIFLHKEGGRADLVDYREGMHVTETQMKTIPNLPTLYEPPST